MQEDQSKLSTVLAQIKSQKIETLDLNARKFIHYAKPEKLFFPGENLNCFVETKDFVVYAANNGKLCFRDKKTLSMVLTLVTHQYDITALMTLTPNIIASGARNGVIKIWNIESKACLAEYHFHHSLITSLAGDEHILVSGDVSGKISFIDLKEKCLTSQIDYCSKILGLISTNESLLINVQQNNYDMQASESDNDLLEKIRKLFSYRYKTVKLSLLQASNKVKIKHINGVGIFEIKINHEDKKTRLLPIEVRHHSEQNLNLRYIKKLWGHGCEVLSVDINHNNELVSVDKNGKVIVWDIQTGDILRVLDANNFRIRDIFILGNGDILGVSLTSYHLYQWKCVLNPATDQDYRRIFQALHFNSSVTTLRLGNASFSNNIIAYLTELLAAQKFIISLSMENVNFTMNQFKRFKEGIMKNKSLLNLYITLTNQSTSDEALGSEIVAIIKQVKFRSQQTPGQKHLIVDCKVSFFKAFRRQNAPTIKIKKDDCMTIRAWAPITWKRFIYGFGHISAETYGPNGGYMSAWPVEKNENNEKINGFIKLTPLGSPLELKPTLDDDQEAESKQGGRRSPDFVRHIFHPNIEYVNNRFIIIEALAPRYKWSLWGSCPDKSNHIYNCAGLVKYLLLTDDEKNASARTLNRKFFSLPIMLILMLMLFYYFNENIVYALLASKVLFSGYSLVKNIINMDYLLHSGLNLNWIVAKYSRAIALCLIDGVLQKINIKDSCDLSALNTDSFFSESLEVKCEKLLLNLLEPTLMLIFIIIIMRKSMTLTPDDLADLIESRSDNQRANRSIEVEGELDPEINEPRYPAL